jgi:hypothetical protein
MIGLVGMMQMTAVALPLTACGRSELAGAVGPHIIDYSIPWQVIDNVMRSSDGHVSPLKLIRHD